MPTTAAGLVACQTDDSTDDERHAARDKSDAGEGADHPGRAGPVRARESRGDDGDEQDRLEGAPALDAITEVGDVDARRTA